MEFKGQWGVQQRDGNAVPFKVTKTNKVYSTEKYKRDTKRVQDLINIATTLSNEVMRSMNYTYPSTLEELLNTNDTKENTQSMQFDFPVSKLDSNMIQKPEKYMNIPRHNLERISN